MTQEPQHVVTSDDYAQMRARVEALDATRVDKAIRDLSQFDDPSTNVLLLHHVMREVQRENGWESTDVAKGWDTLVQIDSGHEQAVYLGPEGPVGKEWALQPPFLTDAVPLDSEDDSVAFDPDDATDIDSDPDLVAPVEADDVEREESGFMRAVRQAFDAFRAQKADPGVNAVHHDTPEWEKPRFSKSVGSRRFTLGPMYIPDTLDAHAEWTDADELQQAAWEYVRLGDRRIRLQHNVDVVAGEWVEIMTWPYPVTVPMMDPSTGEPAPVEFPSGTVFLGVIWEPWAWELVLTGKIRGFSIGGMAERIEVSLAEGTPTPDAAPAED